MRKERGKENKEKRKGVKEMKIFTTVYCADSNGKVKSQAKKKNVPYLSATVSIFV